MININEIRRRYRRDKRARKISDADALNFVAMIEAGLSLDVVIEIMSDNYSTNDTGLDNSSLRESCLRILRRSNIVRLSPLFCKLLGVRSAMLAETNKLRFDDIDAAHAWMVVNGYMQLPKKRYTDCIEAWCKANDVAKVQKLPSGKFLVQEFKIV